jgi:hypothetical protein
VQSIDQKTYLSVVDQKLYAIRKLTKDLQRALPSQVSAQFIRALVLITSAVETFLLFRVNYLRATLGADPAELEVQIAFNARVALRILGTIHQQYLPLLHAGSRHNEYLVYPSIDRAVKLFTSEVELTLIPDFEYNYAFVGIETFALREIDKLEKHSDQATQAALAGVKKDAAAIKRWITFLHFPMADRDSALSLCILAHELAHLVDKHMGLYQELIPKELDKDSFERLVAARRSSPVQTGPGGPQLTLETLFTKAWVENQCYLACTQMLENWVREIIADILAVHAIGPACYFAFNDFFAYMGSENRSSRTHPPAAFRLLGMLDELKDMGYMISSEMVDIALTAGLQRVTSDATHLKYAEEAEVVQKTIQTNQTDLLAKIRKVTSKYSFGASRYQDSVPTVLNRLKAGIAPIEFYDEKSDVMRPASVRAILNAGWELYKTDLTSFYANFKAGGEELERLDNLNQLLFKAVEASEVKRQWR